MWNWNVLHLSCSSSTALVGVIHLVKIRSISFRTCERFSLGISIVIRNVLPVSSCNRVRVTDLPILNTPRTLRKYHLGSLVRVRGVVSKSWSVYPQLALVKLTCGKCVDILGPFTANSSVEVNVNKCPTCQSRGPFNIYIHWIVIRTRYRINSKRARILKARLGFIKLPPFSNPWITISKIMHHAPKRSHILLSV